MPPLVYHLCSIAMILKYRSGTVDYTQTLSQAVFCTCDKKCKESYPNNSSRIMTFHPRVFWLGTLREVLENLRNSSRCEL